MHRLHMITLAAASLAISAGCGSDPKPGPSVAASGRMASDGTARPAVAARQDTSSPNSGSIHIEDKILKACGNLPIAHFAFDSSTIQGDAATALDALARCFATGALKGRGMKLIGHTDQRGETEYNLALGQRRAGSVAAYIGAHGVERARIAASSHGEFDATGTDEEGWARDRKVDVLLAE
jgi:peptidoglycan-associated lipoprotein